ncbi:hypothetical protein KKE33_01060, partial [Patescibacteria group bacterium]|nr:hypothetical protein [Patescibacteria group bacterium]
MKDFHLDLEDKNSVLDFLVQAGFYANKKDKAIAKDLVDMCESDERISNEKIAHVARELAISTWPARSAVNYFFKKKAAGDEWIKVTEMVRPATATLMHRFRKGAGARTLDSLLEHPDIGD